MLVKHLAKNEFEEGYLIHLRDTPFLGSLLLPVSAASKKLPRRINGKRMYVDNLVGISTEFMPRRFLSMMLHLVDGIGVIDWTNGGHGWNNTSWSLVKQPGAMPYPVVQYQHMIKLEDF
ncbi:hypothetical protein OUZ56_027511 [Daphnia magna]|uniref:Uncharacterized protein n=1 Tax=Daphnia magna TaxID=35525 RepID=A0ABQ9ZQV5_9CRUS|nr:hypothetical protein OUZ56_027511 [Daphnia magna]